MNFRICLAIPALVIALLAPAEALEVAANGKRLAKQWCASCHLVTPDQENASTSAPPFMTIARRGEVELLRLPLFLANPAHSRPGTPMPDFNLSRQAIADLVAYIRSLRP